MFNKQEIGTTY